MDREEPDVPRTVDQKTLFLVNTLVIHTVQLLNNFAIICEEKLADVHRRILRADAKLSLLETRLHSIDGPESTEQQRDADFHPPLPRAWGSPPSPRSEQSVGRDETLPTFSTNPAPSEQTGTSGATSPALVPSSEAPEIAQVPAKDDPKFARFFKMLQVGVPLPAVKLQLPLEGLDSSVLDDPELPASGTHDVRHQ